MSVHSTVHNLRYKSALLSDACAVALRAFYSAAERER
jgi:hypothetical protein